MNSTKRLATCFCTLFIALGGCGLASRQDNPCTGTGADVDRVLLQQVHASGIIIKWRGAATSVCVGEQAGMLTQRIDAVLEEGYHIARVTGLQSDRQYYYSIGAASTALAGHRFRTAPATGTVPGDGKVRLWLLGDSGTASEVSGGKPKYPGQATAVRDGFLRYNREHAGGDDIDLLLLLGDNAYTAGTDAEWQQAFFEVYPGLLASTPVYPTIGNHEMGYALVDFCSWYELPQCTGEPLLRPYGGTSQQPDPMSYDVDGDGKPDGTGPPYLSIFTLPGAGEMGGVPSGTEQYYSADYANVHLVSLDSQLSARDENQLQAMRDWLVDDLAANRQDWTIVIFHHPPYSKGMNHDSDREDVEIFMRETFAPLFEQHGVDVVYSGHAHSYERSWYLAGHHGPSASFDPKRHAELNASDKPSLGQSGNPYQQISAGSGVDDKAVYTVAGSAGKVTTPKGLPKCEGDKFAGCNMGDWLQHPAHRTFDSSLADHEPHGVARLGSVVIDISDKRLVSRFVDARGEVLDYFIIEK